MISRTRIARRLEATLAVTALLLVLALSWELRPALPQFPQSFSAPLPSSTIGATLELAAWLVFVLLDLVLIRKVLQFAIRRRPTRTELRLRRAFAERERSSLDGTGDWRAYAAPLAPPVLRIAADRESADREPTSDQLGQCPRGLPASVEIAATDTDEDRPGLLLLGPLELTGCKKVKPRRQATTELLAYLAIQGRPVGRDELLEALWPGEDPRRSAGRFYQAASEARKLLGDAFQRQRDAYSVTNVPTDLDELEQLRERAAANNEGQRGLLERAIALFRGDALSGIDALWAVGEQRRLTALRADLLERVGRLRLDSGDASGALKLAEEGAALDPSNERPVRLAMEAEAALGRREAVVERYDHLRRELDGRFGLQPSSETKRLYRRLLGEEDAFARATPA